jgi:hypothetical protein
MSYPDRVIKAPTDLVGCVLWLDAADISSITKDGSDLVSQWNDKSGNAKHAVQATGANQPTYSASGFNGRPCIDWGNGAVVARSMATTSSITLGTYTSVAVVRGDVSGGYLWTHVTDSANGSYVFQRNHSSRVIRAAGTSAKAVLSVPSTWLADGAKRIVTVTFGGLQASHLFRLDGVNQQTVDTTIGNPGTATVSGTFFVGNNQIPGSPFRGVIAELIIFDRALSDGEIVQVERYLAKKWGLSQPRLIASPLDLTGCVLWLDAAQGVTEGGGVVTQWNDQSGLNNHPLQADNTKRPTMVTLGNSQVIRFDGTNDQYTLTSNITASPQTHFAVARLRSAPGNNAKVLILTQKVSFYASVPDGVGNWGVYLGGYVSSGDPIGTDLRVLSLTVVDTPLLASMRGSRSAKRRAPGTAFTGQGATEIAAASGTQVADLDLAELLIFSRALSDGEVALVEDYLARKHRLHPRRQIASPLEVPTCSLWLDSTDLSSITKDGSNFVSQWNDKSGGAFHVTATLTVRPLYTAAGIDFDGINDAMVGAAVSNHILAAQHTIFCVFIADAIDTTGAGATVYNNDGLVTDGAAFLGMHLRTSSGQPQVVAYNWDGNADSEVGNVTLSAKTLAVQAHGDGRLAIRVNGARQAATASGDTTNITNLLQLGRSNGGHYFDGRIYEVIIFKRLLSDGEIALVEQYLARKYGL